jgi:hypothetical protein
MPKIQKIEPSGPSIAEVIRQRCGGKLVLMSASSGPYFANPGIGCRAEEVIPRAAFLYLSSPFARREGTNTGRLKHPRKLLCQRFACRFGFETCVKGVNARNRDQEDMTRQQFVEDSWMKYVPGRL